MTDEVRIRERAYEIWERAGKPDGAELEHWHQARQQLQDEVPPEESEVHDSLSGTLQPGMPSGPDKH